MSQSCNHKYQPYWFPSLPPTFPLPSWVLSGLLYIRSDLLLSAWQRALLFFSVGILIWRMLLEPIFHLLLSGFKSISKSFCLHFSDFISSFIIFCPAEDVFCSADFAKVKIFSNVPSCKWRLFSRSCEQRKDCLKSITVQLSQELVDFCKL